MLWKRQIPILIVAAIGSITLFGWFINEPNVKEFVISVLHEIKHALDAKRLTPKKFKKKYDQAGTMAVYQGKDPHDDNKWEKLAEKWAQREYKMKWSKIFR